ncbi:MAG: PhnD/SsuA/transferrin family substrate-binding protein [Rhodospirillales bacterium]|nr:PhnD/SsuA/transferrin family substrate-binding protein [Rhodospirillales bacterium]
MTVPSIVSAKEVVIGLRAHIGVEKSLKQWQATADYLSQRIDGYTFKLAPFEKLDDLSNAAKRGAFDFVITNPSSYVEMELYSGASRILTLINKRQGKPYSQFGSVIFVRSGRTDINVFDDLRGKTLMAVSEPAFGGWRVAWGELKKQGIDPENDLKAVTFAGGQQKVVYAIRDGKADVGVVRTDMLERMAESGLIDLKDFRSIGQRYSKDFPFMRSTDLYPEWSFAKFPKAPEDLSRKIAHGLLEMSADNAAAQAGKYVGWSVPLNYQPVHDLLKTLKVGPYKDYGKVSLKKTLLAYGDWIAAFAFILAVLLATGAFALNRNRQLALLRSSMLVDKDRELDFQRLALDEHAIVSITDVKGDITYANDKFCNISGYTLDELMGQNHRILKSEDQSRESSEELWQAIANGKTWHGEFKNRKKDGEYFWVKATIVPFLNAEGDPFQYVAIRTDITDKVRAEAELLKAKEEAERANSAKSSFLSSMSHELRTPLHGILGFTQLLNIDSDHPLTPSQLDATDQVLKSGDHLLRLIEDVLDLEAIESGNTSLDLAPQDPGPVIESCKAIAQNLAEQKGLTFFDLTAGWKLPRVSIDETRFRQVLLNLLSNAVKYNREGGTVTLSVKEGEHNSLRISVADSGRGIAEGKQAQLFIPFSRLGLENSDIAGTGIGLSITKELVEAMGGTIGYESTLNLGSTFWLELPIVSGEISVKARNEEPAPTASPIPTVTVETKVDTSAKKIHTILCVEDNPSSLKLLESIIERIPDATMISAHTGELGVNLAEIHQPDVILMDINLPGISGVEALRRLKGSRATSDISVIALTANASKADRALGIEAGFRDYLTKPIDVREVMGAVVKCFAPAAEGIR